MNPGLRELFHRSTPPDVAPGQKITAEWRSPSNIAFIKYWGKRPGQLPLNPSLSMTLEKAVTTTRVTVVNEPLHPGIGSLNQQTGHPFLPKLQHLYALLMEEVPWISSWTLEVETQNSFPHSTGIASSASGISAFVLSLLSIMRSFAERPMTDASFYRAASWLSRLGSGSACRSVYGGFALWGATESVPGSSDTLAIPVDPYIHPDLKSLRDAILIVSSEPKSLASTQGHALMNAHPFAEGRMQQVDEHLKELMHAMKVADLDRMATLVENEALSLHALLMTSHPDGLLLKPASVEIIHLTREARKKGLPVFFTLDAGPNVHLLYPASHEEDVKQFIEHQLIELCSEKLVIYDRCGEGPVAVILPQA